MDAIPIEPSTGHVSTSSMLLTPLTPELHPNSVSRAIKRTLSLESYSGPKPKMETVGGKRMFVASIDTCDFILGNITGQRKDNKCKWDLWRETPAHAEFKRALRECTERVLASRPNGGREQQRPQPEQQQQPQAGQRVHQPQLEQQEPDRHIEEVDAKAAILQKALRSMNIIGDIRVDEATGSIIDLIRLVCPGRSEDHPSKALARVVSRDDGDHVESGEGATDAGFVRGRISQSVHPIPINGTGNETPVGDAKTLVEIMGLLPTGVTREFRRQSAETITRVLGGDVTLCEEIEQRCARLQRSEEGMAYQHFMTGEQPQIKKARFGPPAMMHATDEDYENFVKMEVYHELAMRNDRYAHELTTGKTNHIREQLQDEVGIVLKMKEAF